MDSCTDTRTKKGTLAREFALKQGQAKGLALKHVPVWRRAYVCASVSTCIRACVYAYVRPCFRVWKRACARARLEACVRASVCAREQGGRFYSWGKIILSQV